MNRISKYIEPDIEGTVEELDSILARIHRITENMNHRLEQDTVIRKILDKIGGLKELF